MSKMSTDPTTRHTLNGPTMGTRWAALVHAEPGFDPRPLRQVMQAAVDEVDAQMSTWRPESDLMRFNAAEPGGWVPLPARLIEVLAAGLEVGRLSGGAFEISMGDAVGAWGFGPTAPDAERIRAALAAPRRPAHEVLELDPAFGLARKHAPLALDLSGIAKGHGVDRLAETARVFGISSALVSIDGELRALGLQPDGRPWAVVVERPDPDLRAPHAILALEDAAVATSGDYRHWVEVGGRRLSHTMDPRRGGPLAAPPASVTVVAETCMAADAFATALMVMGEAEGTAFARRLGLNALLLQREGEGLREVSVGALFGAVAAATEGSRSLHPAS
jgi:thiamine biosynthesis lipoprotein